MRVEHPLPVKRIPMIATIKTLSTNKV